MIQMLISIDRLPYNAEAINFYDVTIFFFRSGIKVLTKYERPKMERDARQKCSEKDCIFGRHLFAFSAVRISLRL